MNQPAKEIEYPKEFMDVYKIIDMGAVKYAPNSWLDYDNPSVQHRANHESMFRHLAHSQTGDRLDYESEEDHLLHLACRALMQYTRLKRGIKDAS